MLMRTLGILTCSLMILGCKTNLTEQPTTIKNTTIIDKNKTNHDTTNKTKQHHDIPQSYLTWLAQGNHANEIAKFEKYLKKHQVERVAPTYQLVKSARGWQQCGGEEYMVADESLWDNLIPTLKLLAELRKKGVLVQYEIVSVYRDPTLNTCVGGAQNSRHTHNSAIDFRIGSRQPDEKEQLLIHQSKAKLCDFWKTHGEKYRMGLGVYKSGIIHIDTARYRSWGADYTQKTSMCL